ncbi:GST-N-Metaxin-like protein [Daphnia pulex]|uniref:GST-N-Metaxin-like protein n=1 Tax=Daphnia pulex TaxID=6669 RepID=E9G0M2_DAPPU|nr:GST-N-Metaxin-like protein [Daphnia pulex]|eukprot:EFX86930.1 GST-N-Metaxin-like protein [Daphnia pulex]
MKKRGNDIGQDVVVLHQLDRGVFTPNISPFPLKLETYLRMANIPYQNDFKNPIGPKGKTPWITLNGVDYSDSQLCLEMLAKRFQKDFSSHLSAEEQAVARSLQIMAEEHFYWLIVLQRFVYTKGKTLFQIQTSLPSILRLMMPIIARKVKSQTQAQGMGRHTKEEAIEMGMKDLRAMSTFLGTKPYFMGEKPTEMDCSMFGILAQVVWSLPGSSFESHMNGEFLNLRSFCNRMKSKFWPDWDQCLSSPQA